MRFSSPSATDTGAGSGAGVGLGRRGAGAGFSICHTGGAGSSKTGSTNSGGSSGWDILSEYRYQFPGKIRENRSPVRLTVNDEELSRERETPAKVAQEPKKSGEKKPKLSLLRKKVIDNSEKSAYSDFKKTHSALTADEQSIVSALEKGQRLVDDVIAELDLAPGVILAALTMLEIKGVVRRLPGRYVELTGK